MWKNIKNPLIFSGVLTGLFFLLSFAGGIGKVIFTLYPFCNDTSYSQTPNSLHSHCYDYDGIDISLLYLLIATAIAMFVITILRTIKISLGKTPHSIALIGLCLIPIGFLLLGITPLIFFLGLILFVSIPFLLWISKLVQHILKRNQ